VKAIAYGNYEQLPFSFRETLKSIGNQEIIKMEVIRAPISNVIMSLMNAVSGFQLQQKIRDSEYDTLFHLSLRIYTKRGNVFDLEKEDVVKIGKAFNRPKQEVMPILINQGMTINQLIQNTINKIGMRKFNYYDGKTNNCQVFLIDILSSNQLLNNEMASWIKQDTTDLVFNNRNPYFSKILNTVTDTGNRINTVLTEGMGTKKKSPWLIHVRKYREQNPEFSWKECLIRAKDTY
jgi:hypothetical protein